MQENGYSRNRANRPPSQQGNAFQPVQQRPQRPFKNNFQRPNNNQQHPQSQRPHKQATSNTISFKPKFNNASERRNKEAQFFDTDILKGDKFFDTLNLQLVHACSLLSSVRGLRNATTAFTELKEQYRANPNSGVPPLARKVVEMLMKDLFHFFGLQKEAVDLIGDLNTLRNFSKQEFPKGSHSASLCKKLLNHADYLRKIGNISVHEQDHQLDQYTAVIICNQMLFCAVQLLNVAEKHQHKPQKKTRQTSPNKRHPRTNQPHINQPITHVRSSFQAKASKKVLKKPEEATPFGVHIKGIHFGMDKQQFESQFSEFSQPPVVTLPLKKNGKNKGFAFVYFHSEEERQFALESEWEVWGRKWVVAPCQSENTFQEDEQKTSLDVPSLHEQEAEEFEVEGEELVKESSEEEGEEAAMNEGFEEGEEEYWGGEEGFEEGEEEYWSGEEEYGRGEEEYWSGEEEVVHQYSPMQTGDEEEEVEEQEEEQSGDYGAELIEN